MWARTAKALSKLPRFEETAVAFRGGGMFVSRSFGKSVEGVDGDKGTVLNRDFLVRLWVADWEMRSSRAKRKQQIKKYKGKSEDPADFRLPAHESRSVSQHPFWRWFVSSKNPIAPGKKRALKQPPPSQSRKGFLEPTSAHEDRIAPLLSRSNLLITRDIEWANLALGFEQENQYAILDVYNPQAPVGYIREQSNVIARQLLRLRRPFMAYVTDVMGDELFTIRRPFWWITSSIYAEIDGKEVGVVHRRWHLWRRIYDLYLGNKQFAVVENPGLWNWTFTLKDIDGNVLAEIDRNWRGFGFEILTDAGQYAIRFGSVDPIPRSGPSGIQELEVTRPLTLSERAVTLALAVSLDNDYFSRHGGWGLPFIAVEE